MNPFIGPEEGADHGHELDVTGGGAAARVKRQETDEA